jgi:hypothetical protein
LGMLRSLKMGFLSVRIEIYIEKEEGSF